MPRYRRLRVPGGTYFFTVAAAHRGTTLLTDRVDLLRLAVAETRAERPFRIEAWVVLPDHLHAVWTLPEGDADYSTRWGAIKARFSRAVRSAGALPVTDLPAVQGGRFSGLKPGLRAARRESPVWQRRFWEHTVRDEAEFAHCVEYCWSNPVKHGLAQRPADWPYSSVHRDRAESRFPPTRFSA